MPSPMDAVFEGYGFDAQGVWHYGSLMDYWRWGFSDLGDGEVKGCVAELIVKVLLHTEPETMTMDEIQLLRMSRLSQVAEEADPEPAYQYDA